MTIHATPLQLDPSFTAPALTPHSWPFKLQDLPASAYLVGGSVRDGLLGRQTRHLDLDFVLPSGAVKTARAIAHTYKAGFVLLDAERHIARVVFEQATADFAQQVGETLDVDLRRRDFTINAIAYHPHTATFYDPLGGCDDLKRRCLRMISLENLQDDPLRLLRAYRQAAQLDFHIAGQTQETIRHLAALLKQVAPERVHAELSYLLSSQRGTPMLTQAWEDGLLDIWLPHANRIGLAWIARMDEAAIALVQVHPAFDEALTGWVRDQQQAAGTGRSWFKVAKLSCLVSPDPDVAETELWTLKCSRAEVQAILTLLRVRPQLREDNLTALTRREQYQFFQEVGVTFPAVAVLAIATGASLPTIQPLVQRFLTAADPVAHPNPLVTGHDLMTQLQMKPGRHIGKLLERLQIAHAEGEIATPEEALTLARQHRQQLSRTALEKG
ncbi:MAG: CCA tRNA nucleotidyltransferase [Synechococcales bacterium]|nr:CCA tRNA nucleotidyltransferase [Synechococcales bacterium]